jgi:hypothetical protein
MNRFASLFLAVFTFAGAFGRAQAQDPTPPPAPLRSSSDLDLMLGAVALYPDPLLADLLAASTYPAQIVVADRAIQGGLATKQVSVQTWDASVKALAHYPDLLKWMDDNLVWTSAVGDAFIAQPEDVAESIQRLRSAALGFGNLTGSAQDRVINHDGTVEIVPADPNWMSIPDYDPSLIYYDYPPAGAPWVVYEAPVAVGGWLIFDWDWRDHHIVTWPHDHPRPPGWWQHAPGASPRVPAGTAGGVVWRPPARPGRGQPRNWERDESGHWFANPVARGAEYSRGQAGASSGGALTGAANRVETRASSSRGQESRGSGGGGGGGGQFSGGGGKK